MSYYRQLKARMKSKKGSSVLEFAFGLLTFVMLFSFAVDIIMITQKQYTVSQTANQLVRQISVQGGVKPSAPSGYPGGNRAYMDSREMNTLLKQKLNGLGIKDDEWSMKLEGFDRAGYPTASSQLSNSTNVEVDYQDVFEFEIQYKYKWNIMGQLVPMMKGTNTAVQSRSATSEFKYSGL